MAIRARVVLFAVCAAVAVAAQTVAGQPTVRWLFIIDDYHLDFVNTGRLRDQLRDTANALIRPGDAFALHCTGPSRAAVEWSSDRSALDAAIRFLVGNGLKFSDVMAIAAGAQRPDGRAEATLAKLLPLLDSLDPSAGNMGIIFFSNGYSELPDRLRDAAARTRIPIFAIDPRLVEYGSPGALEPAEHWEPYWDATRRSLRTLTEINGGVLLESRSDLKPAAGRFEELVRR